MALRVMVFPVLSTPWLMLLCSWQNLFDDLEQVVRQLLGFTSHPVAPRRLPSSRLAASLSVVNVRIGKEPEARQRAHFADQLEASHHRHIDVGKDEIGLDSRL
jgi:hypothetical protein